VSTRTGKAVHKRGWGTELRPSEAHIVETALALRQSPAERFRLLAQPLPKGIAYLMEVASGAPQALRDASMELGEAEAVVLEAARFYLEQMLFAATDADAYRILGVSPQAEHEQIRLHHRLLQRWLHPDRALAGDASVFATRVNQAWSQLRTPALRRDYDAARAHGMSDGPVRGQAASNFRSWNYEDAEPRQGRRSRWLFAAALACSALLAVLIVRHEDDAAQSTWEDATVADAQPAVKADVSEPGKASDISALSNALGSRAPASAPPRKLLASQEADRVPPPARTVARLLASSNPAAPARLASLRGNETSKHPFAAVSVATAPASLPAPRRPRAAAPTSNSGPQALASRTQFPRQPARTEQAAAGSVAVVSRSPEPAAAAPAPSLLAMASPAPVSPDLAPPVPPPSPAPARAPSDGDPAILLDRMHKAEQRVAQVAAYLSATPGASPLWNDVRTQADADRLRRRLAGRQGAALQLLAPNWQLRPDDASYSSPWRCDRCGMGEGRLEVRLVWREGLWLVRSVGLGPSA
jgi:curved DNA-binding protein CbpA